jgi:ABC-type multidrug transport system ATPase subunit
MMALCGYLPPSQGRSRINGQDLYQSYNAFRGNIGYVPQDDIIHQELTVWEALYYSAKLRLPPDTRRSEIDAIITRVLEQLEIADTRDVLIGSPERKGISGGQRKRVNLALELITEPSLLFLDEPTSGLASEDTINVMRLLRRLADDGRTILLTIHQPSLEAYRKLDNVVYLADGHLVYYGPAYPDSITYFNPDVEEGTPARDALLVDPGNALKPIAEDRRRGRDMRALADEFRESELYDEYVSRRRGDAGEAKIKGGSKQKTRRRFGLRQWWTLTRRYFTIKRKDFAGTAILLLQAPIIAGIIALVFWGETGDAWGRVEFSPFALFLLVVSAVWFGCSNAAREIVAEQAIYRRERMLNLKIPSYVMSKFAVLGGVCALQCLMLLVPTWSMLGFKGSFLEMFSVLLLCALSGLGMGLVLSSVVRTSEAAIALVPLLLIPQVILGGLIMPVHKMSAPMRVASTVMVSRWGFEAMLHAEGRIEALEVPKKEIEKRTNKVLSMAGPARGSAIIVPPPPPKPIERFFGEDETHSLVDCSVLCSFVWLMLSGVVVILWIRDPAVG